MELWLWGIIGILICIIFSLSVKLYLMRKSAREIETELEKRLTTETNILIDISSRDRYMRRLAVNINTQLCKLRSERRRFQRGDLELKEAITNISHDLRTPLTAIFGYLDLLEQESKSEQAAKYLSQIENRVEALKQLTEELFRYSVVTSTQEALKEKIDLRCVLEECLLSFYGAMKQKNLTPDISIPDERIERFLNPSAVNRIFSNIISNALKYSDGDFEVKMDTDGIIVFANTAKELAAVSIGRLFDRFYTVETGRNSTGLGLSIAKLLTEQLGGTIKADYYDFKLYIIVHFPV